MKNKVQDVRNLLIARMEAIEAADPANKELMMAEIEKGRAMSELAKAITDTARVEVEAMKALDGHVSGSGFLQVNNDGLQPKAALTVRN